jgi:hypothetical protein
MSKAVYEQLVQRLQRDAAEARTYVAVAEQRAREAAELARAKAALAASMTPDDVQVMVTITDPWDDTYRDGLRGSVTVQGTGLAQTVRDAERQHKVAAGKVRTDGVLGYRVTATLQGVTVDVADEDWLPFSEQTSESMRKRRETDERINRGLLDGMGAS